MTVLVLRLAGPLQSWGSSSRFARRGTDIAPTKSGVIGMLAAAKGIRRTEPLTELLGLKFGVRLDQPGQILRDFQTARSLDGRASAPLTYRFYLSDAIFLAGVHGDPALLHDLAEALKRPRYPLYLGRRSCPPAGPVSLGVHDITLDDALDSWPWLASERFRRRAAPTVRLEVVRDARPGEPSAETLPDEPVSFDPAHRQHTWRSVLRRHVDVPNDLAERAGVTDHDPLSLLGG
ncbi:type I-E CRISPR-associated protein Cas5/CasD [Actinoplanes lobatus]|uniref:CRISPR system Cascade subunit CasD n=1 Tax=Actinoplanes lobatus TaxID=113568 RepID=A0A7W7HL33_9ACTN|nr:type I-E CRISPR-associated protein Cas5/CasD [Actinoplanes lobatus]MBB4752526.1 CRISPR system Cascade subunit CasD [Actinoplanes lobatus]GGN93980.1 type I-E CRISPR-associated protein Cas5/CasD [Actinoplanes lobatus]GIE44826.1 type I-E CRISPR-associated protein Cas5/CasD [Actinoplanes lobatus]